MWQERLYNTIVCEYEHQSGTLMINFNVDLAKIQFHRAKKYPLHSAWELDADVHYVCVGSS